MKLRQTGFASKVISSCSWAHRDLFLVWCLEHTRIAKCIPRTDYALTRARGLISIKKRAESLTLLPIAVYGKSKNGLANLKKLWRVKDSHFFRDIVFVLANEGTLKMTIADFNHELSVLNSLNTVTRVTRLLRA